MESQGRHSGRVCLLVNPRQGKALVLGDGFQPTTAMLDSLRSAGLFKGIASVHANVSAEAIEDSPSKATLMIWAIAFSDKLDFAGVEPQVADLEKA